MTFVGRIAIGLDGFFEYGGQGLGDRVDLALLVEALVGVLVDLDETLLPIAEQVDLGLEDVRPERVAAQRLAAAYLLGEEVIVVHVLELLERVYLRELVLGVEGVLRVDVRLECYVTNFYHTHTYII